MIYILKSKGMQTCILISVLLGFMVSTGNAKEMSKALEIDRVTVFLKGAEVYSSGAIQLPAGESEVVLTNVASRLNEKSLSLHASGGVVVLSTTLRRDYRVEEEAGLSPEALALKKELDAVKIRQEKLLVQKRVVEEQLAIIDANKQLTPKEGTLDVKQVDQMVQLVAKHMTEALEKQANVKRDLEKINREIQQLEQQFQQESQKGYQPGGQLVVRFYAPQPAQSKLHLSYVANDAGWMPTYDLVVEKKGEPVNLTYKARVFQNTGIDWKSVKLTLSTGNPSLGVQTPILRPWYLDIYEANFDLEQGFGAVHAEVAAAPAPVVMKVKEERKVVANTLDGYVTTNAEGINTEYEINVAYNVPSDGQGHQIMVKSNKVKATYQYVALPRYDRGVFLQAKLTNWEDLNLLPGATSVYYEGSFIGQGRIDLAQIEEGLELSLGRDQRIRVERIEDEKNKAESGFLGNNMNRTFGYTIKVHNTRPDGIQLVVKDQLPVSLNQKITLQDLKLGGAEHIKTTGELNWTVDMKAGEQKEIKYSYVVRYPKDQQVQGL